MPLQETRITFKPKPVKDNLLELDVLAIETNV